MGEVEISGRCEWLYAGAYDQLQVRTIICERAAGAHDL